MLKVLGVAALWWSDTAMRSRRMYAMDPEVATLWRNESADFQ